MEDQEVFENDLIRDVMASMGWQNSFVPIATEENKQLLNAIKFLGKTKLERIDVLEGRGIEENRLRKLFTAADNEFDQNLKLLTAHKSQYSTEHHLFKLSEHDESKFKQILKEAEKTHKDLTAQQENFKGFFYRCDIYIFMLIFLFFSFSSQAKRKN
jgi:hypothetical protein